ncbi:MAG: S1 RNA-binding domain-containing protein, partial [Planctomycetota bacterium]|nr:S1 RNA-binding domain-containing protein [Planctomycetota bacterium]
TGNVTKITNFGVFIGLEDGLEGLLHISEMTDNEVEDPETLVSVGQEIEVKVLRVDAEDRKIGLSLKRVDWSPEQEAKAKAEEEGSLESPEDLKGGLGGGGPLFQVPTEEEAEAETVGDEGDTGDSSGADDGQADEEADSESTKDEEEVIAESEEDATAEAEEDATAESAEDATAEAEEEDAEASDDEDEGSAESDDSEEA